jgi:hypothetical protein
VSGDGLYGIAVSRTDRLCDDSTRSARARCACSACVAKSDGDPLDRGAAKKTL